MATRMVDPFPDPPVPEIDSEGLMVPPWVKYPAIPLGSIGWRMGEAEGYWDDFRAWWLQQPQEVRQRVQSKYSEPVEWLGFYKDV